MFSIFFSFLLPDLGISPFFLIPSPLHADILGLQCLWSRFLGFPYLSLQCQDVLLQELYLFGCWSPGIFSPEGYQWLFLPDVCTSYQHEVDWKSCTVSNVSIIIIIIVIVIVIVVVVIVVIVVIIIINVVIIVVAVVVVVIIIIISLCRLIYPGFEISQFFVHLILKIIKNQLTRAFADSCQLHQLRHPGDVVLDAARNGDDEAPSSSSCLPSLSCWWCCPIPVVNYTFLHLCWGLGWGLWCIWPLSLLSQTIWALLSIPQCSPTPRNVGGDQRGCVWKPPKLSS